MKTKHIKFTNALTFWAIALAVLTGVSTRANSIIQGQESGELNVVGFAPIGQTFTAEDAQISTIGFMIRNASQSTPGGNTFRYDLLSGAGISGPLIYSVTFGLPDGFSGYADESFSPVTLNPGAKYTVLITAPDGDWVISWNQFEFGAGGPIPGRINYPGGDAIVNGSASLINDLTFRVLQVPEPGASALLLSGIAAFLGRSGWNRSRKLRRGQA